MKAHLVTECVDESITLVTAAKDGMWGPLSTGDLFLYWAKVHSLYCLANSFFFIDKSVSSSGENISCILPLSPNLPIFINSWQGRILSSDFWFCNETVGFFLSLSWTFWQIKHSSSFEGFGLGISCTTLDGPGVFSYMFVLVRLS